MADDLGWRDIAAYGSETFETPHLDALAKRGLLYTNAYSASPLCSPTRAATLTGQTPGRLRLTTPAGHLPRVVLDPQESRTAGPGLPMTEPETRTRLPLDTFTLGHLFRNVGYTTALMGKWHLGYDPYIPENFGFDVVVGGRGDPGPPRSRFFGPWDPDVTNMPAVEGSPNADDVIGDAAVEFIAAHAKEPFFLACWLYNPHAPFDGKPEVIEAFRPKAEAARYQQSAIMGSMVKTIDDNVGKIVAALEAQGLTDNTLIIFTSDNGGNMYDRPEGVYPTNNHPLRSGKGNNYEGGVRVPLIVSWPSVLPEGRVSHAVSISYDWFPTFAELIGGSVPDGHPVDGLSLLPALREESFERGPIFSLFGHTTPATGNIPNAWVRDGKWKLLRFFHTGPDQNDKLELYDLSVDVGETNNLALRHPEVARRLNAILTEHLEATNSLLPRKNPRYDPQFRQMGFEMLQGGLLMGGPGRDMVFITGKDRRVVLRYHPEADATGHSLRFEMETNCAVSVTAGVGETPVFGSPVALVPDARRRAVKVPLASPVGQGDTVTVSIDLGHPGRVQIFDPRLDD